MNFGQGKETTIEEVIYTICEEMNYPKSDINYQPARPADVRRHYADTSLAKTLFGYEPKTSLREAIRLTVEWYKKCDLAAR